MQVLQLGVLTLTKHYLFSHGRRLIIAGSALDTLHQHVQVESSLEEAGGVLLGRHLIESADIIIDEASIPQASDRRSRFSFFRSSKHNSIATARWKESGGKVAYVGLWHSHPEAIPNPSGRDLDDWRKALAKDQFDGDYLFFIILGMQELGCWAGNRQGSIIKLSETNEN